MRMPKNKCPILVMHACSHIIQHPMLRVAACCTSSAVNDVIKRARVYSNPTGARSFLDGALAAVRAVRVELQY